MIATEFRFDLKTRSACFELVPLFDLHYGCESCNISKLKETIQYIKSRPNCRFYLGGDMIEGINMSDKRFALETVESNYRKDLMNLAYAQIDGLYNLLKPIADKCLFLLEGNHELTVKNRYYFDACSVMAEKLKVSNFEHSALIRFCFTSSKTMTKEWILFTEHGHGAGRKIGAKIGSIVAVGEGVEADAYIMGHNHGKAHVCQPRIHIGGHTPRIIEKEKTYVLAGSYKKTYAPESTYGERAGYLPVSLGSLSLQIYPFLCERREGKPVNMPVRVKVNTL